MEKETKKLTWEQFVKRNEDSFKLMAQHLPKRGRRQSTA